MLLLLCMLASLAAASAIPTLQKRQSALDGFVSSERAISIAGALANIGGLNSSLVPGAFPGIVVASPSTVNPDYFYTWTRDSALTYTMLVDELIFGNRSLQHTIEDYTTAQAVLQTVTNPSGSLWPAGLGLGEPKFYTNETRFNGDWGRPQRDGPALRSIVFMNLAAALIALNETNVVQEIYWPLILNDLKYVGQYWNQTGYDLWEEVHGSSFFTIDSQHRALVQAGLLAAKINETCEPCKQAPEILCFLTNNFWNESGNYLSANINVNNVNRSQINTDPILGSIHNFDINATCDTPDYQPCNSKMLATHKVLVDSFRNLYPINHNATAPNAVAIGRYPEDTYFEGNPWYLCTLACAELLYDAVAQFRAAGKIYIDEYSIHFFQDIYPTAVPQAVYVGPALDAILAAMTTYADGFVQVVQSHLPANGSISEQFNASTGTPLSAYDLTWSFASFVTMAQRRSGQYPLSWGAATLGYNSLPKTCAATSYNSTGTYSPAFAAQTAFGGPVVNISTACVTEVLFTVNATTSFGQNIYLIGNTSLLGGSLTDPNALILPCSAANYTSVRPEWFVDIYLPAGVPVQYKYVNQLGNGTLVFENVTRIVHPSPCGGGEVATNDAGSFPGLD